MAAKRRFSRASKSRRTPAGFPISHETQNRALRCRYITRLSIVRFLALSRRLIFQRFAIQSMFLVPGFASQAILSVMACVRSPSFIIGCEVCDDVPGADGESGPQFEQQAKPSKPDRLLGRGCSGRRSAATPAHRNRAEPAAHSL